MSNDNHDDHGRFASGGGGGGGFSKDFGKGKAFSDALARQEARDRTNALKTPMQKGVDSHHAGVPQYNREAVNKAINNASRFQGKVSGSEARAIHALLKGRHS